MSVIAPRAAGILCVPPCLLPGRGLGGWGEWGEWGGLCCVGGGWTRCCLSQIESDESQNDCQVLEASAKQTSTETKRSLLSFQAAAHRRPENEWKPPPPTHRCCREAPLWQQQQRSRPHKRRFCWLFPDQIPPSAPLESPLFPLRDCFVVFILIPHGVNGNVSALAAPTFEGSRVVTFAVTAGGRWFCLSVACCYCEGLSMKSNLLQLGLPSSQRRLFQPRQGTDNKKKSHIHTHTGAPSVQNQTLNEQFCKGVGEARR